MSNRNVAPQYPLYSWRTQSPTARLAYIRDVQEAEIELMQPLTGPLGFDLEWKPNYVKGEKENPVALVQLASADRILLFQVTAMSAFPQALRDILGDPSIVKAGVSIQNDCKKLWNDYTVNVANCVDLGLLARTVDNPSWKGKYSNPIGLARLSETYLGRSLSKGKTTRSNWEAVLSAVQQEYAANDCHSGWALFMALSPMISSLPTEPLPSFYSFDLVRGMPYQPSAMTLPMSMRAMWNPFNPLYDPGPPPEPRAERPASEQSGSGSARGGAARCRGVLSRFSVQGGMLKGVFLQGFLFDWTPAGQTPPVPTTAQCDQIHIKWDRGTEVGPNPTAPYYLQIYTSTFIVPFVIEAGRLDCALYTRDSISDMHGMRIEAIWENRMLT
ncbi:hypothetical protein EUX98_g5906 [Antrodiella citrinella]|uniref:3'-5' exonuclease n=1 Tax=Antrodiella citrinella TaxID=2447956 RepID=A0A4S4MQM7_9APHY|nr:hypothetical protein EUX98_g5906 [Antrodiella citrinella]